MGNQIPPSDPYAERTMIGLAMTLGRIPHGAAMLTPADFYLPVHETLWAAMVGLVGQQKPCDITSLRAYLQRRGLPDNHQGVPDLYLLELLETPPAADATHVAETILSLSKRRALIQVFERGLQRAHESLDDVETQLHEHDEELQRIERVAKEPTGYQFLPGGQFILDTDPVPTPLWGDGEQVLWADGESLIIAGAQGLGKTTLAQQLALGWAGFPKYGELLGFPIEPGRRLLYLAMDRPQQAARSFRRMVTEDQRAELDDRIVVWRGPPPTDLARHPELLLQLCDLAYADAVILDSLKDAAIPLSDDEVGAGYNLARQLACARGVQLIELHHLRKAPFAARKDHQLAVDDLYGSTWITSGAGSVVLLMGKPGDPIVKMRHLKQPAIEVGPFSILHNDLTGRSEIWHSIDLLALVRSTGSMSAVDAAKALYDTDKPSPAEKEKARRALDRLVASDHLWVFDQGDVATKRPRMWAPK
jgi:hypothetical protein